MVHLGRLLREEVGILQPVVYAVPIDVREALALLACLLDQLLTELHALLGRQLGEDVLGRLLVDVGGKLRGHLLVAGSCFLIGDRLRSLPEVLDKVLMILLLGATKRVVLGVDALVSCSRIHALFSFSRFRTLHACPLDSPLVRGF